MPLKFVSGYLAIVVLEVLSKALSVSMKEQRTVSYRFLIKGKAAHEESLFKMSGPSCRKAGNITFIPKDLKGLKLSIAHLILL